MPRDQIDHAKHPSFQDLAGDRFHIIQMYDAALPCIGDQLLGLGIDVRHVISGHLKETFHRSGGDADLLSCKPAGDPSAQALRIHGSKLRRKTGFGYGLVELPPLIHTDPALLASRFLFIGLLHEQNHSRIRYLRDKCRNLGGKVLIPR